MLKAQLVVGVAVVAACGSDPSPMHLPDAAPDVGRLVLDQSYGTGGITRVPVGAEDVPPPRLVVAADGSAVLVVKRVSSPALLCRLRPDGQLDTAFAAGGCRLSTPITLPLAVAFDGDGLVIAGRDMTVEPAMVRLSANGQIDASFGTIRFPAGDEPSEIVVDADASLVVLGTAMDGRELWAMRVTSGAAGSRVSIQLAQSTLIGGAFAGPSGVLALGSRLPNGGCVVFQLGADLAFAAKPTVPDCASIDSTRAPDGGVLIVQGRNDLGGPRGGILKLGPDGVTDEAFGTGGVAASDFEATSVGVLADGSVVAGTDRVASPPNAPPQMRWVDQTGVDAGVVDLDTTIPLGIVTAMGNSATGAVVIAGTRLDQQEQRYFVARLAPK